MVCNDQGCVEVHDVSPPPPPPSRFPVNAPLLTWVLFVAGIASCSDRLTTEPAVDTTVPAEPSVAGQAMSWECWADNGYLPHTYPIGICHGAITLTSSLGPYLTHYDSYFQPPGQYDTFHAIFSQPVFNLRVWASGWLSCDNPTPPVISHSGPGGSGSTPMVVDFGFCPTSELAHLAPLDINLPSGITSFSIAPPAPFTWFTNGTQPQWLHINYSVAFNRTHVEPTWPWGPLTVDCATGDSILDLQATRDLMKALWDSSRADLPAAQRLEFRGGVFQDLSTGQFSFQIFPATSQGPCHVAAAPQGPLPGKFILGAHTHPFTPGELVACDLSNPSLTGRYRPRFGGPSSEDFSTAAEEVANGGIAHVVIDGSWMYRIVPGADTSNFASKVVPVPRQGPGCTRP
jgi:hypothetical protein